MAPLVPFFCLEYCWPRAADTPSSGELRRLLDDVLDLASVSDARWRRVPFLQWVGGEYVMADVPPVESTAEAAEVLRQAILEFPRRARINSARLEIKPFDELGSFAEIVIYRERSKWRLYCRVYTAFGSMERPDLDGLVARYQAQERCWHRADWEGKA